MPKINLLYVITKLELGGAQKQLLSLITRLDKEKFSPFLFTGPDGLLVEEASSIKGLTINKSRYLKRRINPLNDLLSLSEILRFIKKNNIDIVHTHSSKAGILGRLAAKLAKTKFIIHTVHGWSFNDCQPYLSRIFFIWLERVAARFTDKLIVVSDFDKQKGLRHLIGKEGAYKLIRYGIDYAEFINAGRSIKEEFGINPDDLVVGTVSCLKRQKAPQDFIKLAFLVCQNAPNIKFLLVGSGALRNEVKRLIAKLGLKNKVILAGWRRDIPRIFSTIDIFVLTSLWEGLPIAALEAMLSSIPVVATNTGGIAEVIIDGKTGFLASPRDTKGISEKLALLLRDRNLRSKMGQAAKENLGAAFYLSDMAKNHQDLYNNLFREGFAGTSRLFVNSQ